MPRGAPEEQATPGAARAPCRGDRRAFLQAIVPATAALLVGCQKAGDTTAQRSPDRLVPCDEGERRDPDIEVVRNIVLPVGFGPSVVFRAGRNDER